MNIEYIVIALFGAMSILLLMGKGSWLIAGYNTGSKEEKAKYDEKKLCRSMGVMMLSITLVICLMSYVDTDEFALKMIVPILIIVGIEMIYANRFCLKK